ncbi:MAG TPA: helix-turn-helix domain-containing protein, partial [Syntrophomonadaceae bacterium]|nr:helix-turn-helix domain-containing protein [Syntrophomonadaceae bacterium]
LRNVVERLVVYSKSKYLDFGDDTLIGKKVSAIDESSPKPNTANIYRGPLKSVLKEIEEEYINMVLTQCDGQIGKAAELLGMHRTMLYRKLKATENSENSDSANSVNSSDRSESILYPSKDNES